MEVKGGAFVRRCHCGKIFRFQNWIKPDAFQTRCIAEAFNKGNLSIKDECCDDCVSKINQPVSERE